VTFATYADDTICAGTAILDLNPKSAAAKTFKKTLDDAVTAFVDHTKAGRDAVKSRNVSDYRRWYDGVDTKLRAVVTAATPTTQRAP
jgi:hypothetical protein